MHRILFTCWLLNLLPGWLPAQAPHPVDSLQLLIGRQRDLGDQTGLAVSYLALGEEYFKIFDHEKALQALDEGLRIAEATNNIPLQFRILDITGRTLFWMDQYKEAIEFHWKANKIATEAIPEKEYAANLAHIGEIYLILGNLRQALDYELQAREINETIHDSLGMAAAYDKIGDIYWQMGQHDAALENLKKALSIYRSANQQVYIYQTQSSMAEVYKAMGRLDRAMEEAQSSLEKAEALSYQFGIAYSKGLIGAILLEQDSTDQSVTYLQEAINQFKLAGIRFELAEFSGILAGALQEQGRLPQAAALLDTALLLAEEIQSLPLKVDIFRRKAQLEKARGNAALALRYMEAFVSRQDSLLNIDNENQATYLETEYDLRKRERELKEAEVELRFERFRFLMILLSGLLVMSLIVLALIYSRFRSSTAETDRLGQQNEELSRQNESLTGANEELRRFSDLAATDLRNPVEGMRGELEKLEASLPALENQPAYPNLLRNLGQLDALLAGISAFSVVRNEGDWEMVSLSEVVKDAIRTLPESERTKATRIQIFDLPEVKGNRRQLLQLFQHLLSNAIRFRSQEDPEVLVSGQKSGKDYLIKVKDNGIGIREKDKERIFDLFFQGSGADETAGSGVGLAVSRRIVQQHGGKIWVESKKGEGSTFCFTIPS